MEFVHQAMEAGVKGLLPKNIAPGSVASCLTAVLDGGVWFERELMRRLLEAKAVRLTRRERELLVLVTQRRTNREIARVMGLAEGTVRFYLSRLFKKVLVSNRLELAAYGARTLLAERAGREESRALLEAGLLRLVIRKATDEQACS
jgi:DNA-binding NarL/FixJ family response regulator